jgi:hypothetical protein
LPPQPKNESASSNTSARQTMRFKFLMCDFLLWY